MLKREFAAGGGSIRKIPDDNAVYRDLSGIRNLVSESLLFSDENELSFSCVDVSSGLTVPILSHAIFRMNGGAARDRRCTDRALELENKVRQTHQPGSPKRVKEK
jgi:hypothetical protein